MPIYEYVCDGCRQQFERYVKAWGEAVSCPACASGSVQKQLSRFAMAAGRGPSAGPEPAASGACCGGSCGCAH